VREHHGDVEASRALDIHEVGVGRLHEPLQFVRAAFVFGGRVEQIDGENHGGSGSEACVLARPDCCIVRQLRDRLVPADRRQGEADRRLLLPQESGLAATHTLSAH